ICQRTLDAYFLHNLPEGGEWRYHRLAKLPPNLKKNPLRYGSSLDGQKSSPGKPCGWVRHGALYVL
ncbi:hypothetical protein, partial [Bacteroides caccae]|uniref:hypothetical protein n=1 Tax=Bacteroides caccae TaxID=47678 RepID=UPI0035619A1B